VMPFAWLLLSSAEVRAKPAALQPHATTLGSARSCQLHVIPGLVAVVPLDSTAVKPLESRKRATIDRRIAIRVLVDPLASESTLDLEDRVGLGEHLKLVNLIEHPFRHVISGSHDNEGRY